MIPPGVFPIAQIEQERNPGDQVTKLVQLLGYLLSIVNPNITPKDGKNVSVGERVDVNRHLFTNPPDIFFAIGVRNSLVHPEDCDKPPNEAEIKRAVKHLLNALNEVRDHYRISDEVRREVFQALQPKQMFSTPNFTPINQATPLNDPTKLSSPTPDIPQPSPPQVVSSANVGSSWRPRHPLRWATIFVVVVLLLVYSKTLWQWGRDLAYGSRAVVQVTRKDAEAALKRIQAFDKRQGFAPKATEAQAAWRDAEIAFKQEKYKEAEAGYRRALQISDELIVLDNSRNETQQLFDEIQRDRLAARSAQAQQKAPELWQEAENARRSSDAAFRNGSFNDAKQFAIQAKQKYEEAKAAAEASLASSTTTLPETSSGGLETTISSQPSPSPTLDQRLSPPPTVQEDLQNRPTRIRPKPEPDNQPEEDDTFFIYQKEFIYYVKKQVAPVLPAEAKSQGISGPVTIDVVLSKHGSLSKAIVIDGHPLLHTAALHAVRQWQFRPYYQDRVPIDVRSEITIYVR